MTPDVERLLHNIERKDRERQEAIRQMLRDAGRIDILAQYDEDMKNLRLGITQARSAWHSISAKQRWVLERIGHGRHLLRSKRLPNVYDAYPNIEATVTKGVIFDACRLATARKLCGHELLHADGGAFDPEARFVITERGQFVLKHGRC